MSEERKIKKIEIDALDSIHRKRRSFLLRRLAVFFAVGSIIAVVSLITYRAITGSVVGSRFAVTNMTCPACVTTLKEVTEKIPGVVDSQVSLASQDLIVKFREKQTTPEVIRDAIYRAGYPAAVDGLFLSANAGESDKILIEVNRKPIFERDLNIQTQEEKKSDSNSDRISSIFSVVGRQILLQAADAKSIVVQPYEVEAEANKIISEEIPQGTPPKEWIKAVYGSQEKFYQRLAQNIGMQKLIDEHVTEGISDPGEKRRKSIEWLSKVFLNAEVRIADPEIRQFLISSVGSDDWKVLWPRMIAGNSSLNNLILK